MSKTKIKKPSPAGRLKELEKEYQKGIEVIKTLDAQRANMVQQVLRIEGAKQVLQDIIGAPVSELKPKGPPDGKQSE